MKNREVVITGVAGFIGSNMAEKLVMENRVYGIDNLSWGKKENLESLFKNQNFKFIHMDVKNTEQLAREIEGKDIIIHLSANPDVRKSAEDSQIDFNENALATYSVLEAMRKSDVNEIIFASSSTVYGIPDLMPTPENYGPLKPVSHYGASKLAAEGFIFSFSNIYGFKSSIFRFANVVGRRGTHGVIYDFINKLKKSPDTLEVLGDGTQSKSYIHIDDTMDAMIELHGKGDGLFNIGTATRTSVLEIAKMVISRVSPGAKIKIMGGPGGGGWKGDIKVMHLDIKKALSYGWKYRYESTEAVKKALEELTVI